MKGEKEDEFDVKKFMIKLNIQMSTDWIDLEF